MDLVEAFEAVKAADHRREAELGNPLQMYCQPADVERVRAAVAEARDQVLAGSPDPFPLTWLREELRPVEVHGSPFVPGGKVIVIDPLAQPEWKP